MTRAVMDLRDSEAAKRSPKEVRQQRANSIGKIEKNNTEVFSIPFWCLYLVPDHAYMLSAPRKAWNSCTNWWIGSFAGRWSTCKTPEEMQEILCNTKLQENYALNIQETDFAKLADFTRFRFLWDKDTTCPSPGCWYCLPLPYNLHQPAEEVQNIWCLLIEPVGHSIEGSRSQVFLWCQEYTTFLRCE